MIKERALYICDDFDTLIAHLPQVLEFQSVNGYTAHINRCVLTSHVNEIGKHFETMKRNEPMKVVSLNSTKYYGYDNFECPKCSDKVVKEYNNYCGNCGQKLDWSDEE